jgi:hypothetical protein
MTNEQQGKELARLLNAKNRALKAEVIRKHEQNKPKK